MTTWHLVQCEPLRPGMTAVRLLLPDSALPISGAFTTLGEVGTLFSIVTTAGHDIKMIAGGGLWLQASAGDLLIFANGTNRDASFFTSDGDLNLTAGHGGTVGKGNLAFSASLGFILQAQAGVGQVESSDDLNLLSTFGYVTLADPQSGAAAPIHRFDPRGWLSGEALGFNAGGDLVPVSVLAPSGPAGGALAGTYPNPSLAAVISAGGVVGDATHVPAITWNAAGQLLVVSSVAIAGTPPGGAAGGALAGTYPNPSLAGVISAGGPIGDASHTPAITWNAAGQLLVVTSTAIQITEAQVTNLVADLALKAPLASPALTGTPTAPTAAAHTSTTQLATTAFVSSAIATGGAFVGMIATGAGRKPPDATWLATDGAAVLRATYPDLFAYLVDSATVTITIATPAVITYNAHGFRAGDPVVFTTTGALPTGITAGTTYYVGAVGITTNTFRIRATPAGADIATSGTQSGVQTCTCAPWGNGDGVTTFNVPLISGQEMLSTDGTHPLGSAGGGLTHNHAVGTYAVAGHTHGTSAITVNSHTHAVGTLAVAGHTHGTSAITVNSHTHALTAAAVASHTHGTGTYAVGSHDHTSANHSHTLAAGYAQIANTGVGNIVAAKQLAVTAYAETIHWTVTVSTGGTTSRGGGSALGGSSDATTPGNVGATTPSFTGASGAATPGLTGSTDGTAPGVTGSTDSTAPALSGATAATAPAVTGSTDSTAPALSGSSADATGPIDPYAAVRTWIKATL